MIVTPTGTGLEVVTQPDHARLAAEILALWRTDDMPRHPRRQELILAVREHDNGWRETDSAPRVDPGSGRPVDFRDLERAERFALWRRGVARLGDHPYATALVAWHAIEIHRDRSDAVWEDFREEMRRRGDEAREETGLAVEQLAADYRFLDLCDTLSLVACGAFDRASTRGHVLRAHRRGLRRVVEIDPFPLAGATTFELSSRVIANRVYRDGAHLVDELATARWSKRPIGLAPAGP